MSAKLERIRNEIEKVKSKIADLKAHLKDLERQEKETENMEIVAMVRSVEVAPEDLKAFLANYKNERMGANAAPAEMEEVKND